MRPANKLAHKCRLLGCCVCQTELKLSGGLTLDMQRLDAAVRPILDGWSEFVTEQGEVVQQLLSNVISQICYEEGVLPGCDSPTALQHRPGGSRCHLARLSSVPYRKRSLFRCMEELKQHVGKTMSVRGVVSKLYPLAVVRTFTQLRCPFNEGASAPTCVPPTNKQLGQ